MTPVIHDGLHGNAERSFFLVVSPGLVSLAAREVEDKWQGICGLMEELCPDEGKGLDLNMSTEPAGLTLHDLPVRMGFLLNSCLKIPTRVLMRLREFRCRDFPKLFNKTKKIDWSTCLSGCNPEIQVAARKSRLMHHRRIEETVSSGIRAWFKEQSMDSTEKKHTPTDGSVYIRFDHDDCTISLDTSGEALYKRTPGKKTGPAPIRENLAAALFYKLWLRDTRPPDGDLSIIDPMAGSGTFLSEASSFWQTSQRTTFAYQEFPFVSSSEKLKALTCYPLSAQLTPRGYAFDQNQECVERANENFKAAGLEISVSCQDLFEPSVEPSVTGDWVFVNPPYGRRLESGEIFPFYYKKILNRILEKWRPSLIGMIVPADQLKVSFRVPYEYKMESKLSFLNGGLRVCFLILRHQESGPVHRQQS